MNQCPNNTINDPHHLCEYCLHNPLYNHKWRYEPWYDDRADYNTNAKSYYDYLGRKNYGDSVQTFNINRLLRRTIKVEDTHCIDLTKTGDWIDNGTCATNPVFPDNFDDEITLKAEVILSKYSGSKLLSNLLPTPIALPNAITCRPDGLFAPDYNAVMDAINNKVGTMLQNITDLTNKYNTLKQNYDALKIEADGTKQGLQKIIDNLFATGAITTGGITTFDFSKEGTNTVHLAYGTINHYGLAPDGPYYIKTAKSSPAGSTTVGV